MDNNELKGRIIALEALLTELAIRLPKEVGEAATQAAMPALQRQPAEIRQYTTDLVSQIRRRLPPV